MPLVFRMVVAQHQEVLVSAVALPKFDVVKSYEIDRPRPVNRRLKEEDTNPISTRSYGGGIFFLQRSIDSGCKHAQRSGRRPSCFASSIEPKAAFLEVSTVMTSECNDTESQLQVRNVLWDPGIVVFVCPKSAHVHQVVRLCRRFVLLDGSDRVQGGAFKVAAAWWGNLRDDDEDSHGGQSGRPSGQDFRPDVIVAFVVIASLPIQTQLHCPSKDFAYGRLRRVFHD